MNWLSRRHMSCFAWLILATTTIFGPAWAQDIADPIPATESVPPYRRLFIQQSDLPEVALEGYQPVEVKNLTETLQAYFDEQAATADNGNPAQADIQSFHALARLVGADLVSERSRIIWETNPSRTGTTLVLKRRLLAPWSLALDYPIFKSLDLNPVPLNPANAPSTTSLSNSAPSWVFDDSGRPLVRTSGPTEWFSWSLRPQKNSTPNRLSFNLSLPRSPNGCLVLQLPKSAKITESSAVARMVDNWDAVAQRLSSWPTSDSSKEVGTGDSYWVLELSGQEQVSFSIYLGSTNLLNATNPTFTSDKGDSNAYFNRLIAKQSVQHLVSSELIRSLYDWEWTEYGGGDGSIKLKIPQGTRLKSLTVNDRETSLQFSDQTIEVTIPKTESNRNPLVGAKLRLNAEFQTPTAALREALRESSESETIASEKLTIKPVEWLNGYTVSGSTTLVPNAPWQIRNVRASHGKLDGTRPLAAGLLRFDYSWFHKPATLSFSMHKLQSAPRAELLTRLSTDSEQVSAIVRMQLTPIRAAGPQEIQLAPEWNLDSAQITPKSVALSILPTDLKSPTTLRIEPSTNAETSPIQIELRVSKELPKDPNTPLATTPMIALPLWERRDALIMEPSSTVRLELDGDYADWIVDEEALTLWQKERLPRLGKYLIFKMTEGNLPPLVTLLNPSIRDTKIFSRILRGGNRWSIEHEIKIPLDPPLREPIRIALDDAPPNDPSTSESQQSPSPSTQWSLRTPLGLRKLDVTWELHVSPDKNTKEWIIDPTQLGLPDPNGTPATILASSQLPASSSGMTSTEPVTIKLPYVIGTTTSQRWLQVDRDWYVTTDSPNARWTFDSQGRRLLQWSPSWSTSDGLRTNPPSITLFDSTKSSNPSEVIPFWDLNVAIDASGNQKALVRVQAFALENEVFETAIDIPDGWKLDEPATRRAFQQSLSSRSGYDANGELQTQWIGTTLKLRWLTNPHRARTSSVIPISKDPDATDNPKNPNTHANDRMHLEAVFLGPSLAANYRWGWGLRSNAEFEFRWPEFKLPENALVAKRSLWIPYHLIEKNPFTLPKNWIRGDAARDATHESIWTMWEWYREAASIMGWRTSPSIDTTVTPSSIFSDETNESIHRAPPTALIPEWLSGKWRLASQQSIHVNSRDSTPLKIGPSEDSSSLALAIAFCVVFTPWMLRKAPWITLAVACIASIAGHWLVDEIGIYFRSSLVGVGLGSLVYLLYRMLSSIEAQKKGNRASRADRWLPWNEGTLSPDASNESSGISKDGLKPGIVTTILAGLIGCNAYYTYHCSESLGQDPNTNNTMLSSFDVIVPIDDQGELAGTVVYVPKEVANAIENQRRTQANPDRDSYVIAAKHLLRMDSRSIGFGNTEQTCNHTYEVWIGDLDISKPFRIPFPTDRSRLNRFTVDGNEVPSNRLTRTETELIWYPDRGGRRVLQIESQTKVGPIENERVPPTNPSQLTEGKSPRGWTVETSVLPAANATLEIETDGQWTIDISARGKVSNPSIGRYAMQLGGVDKIAGSLSPNPTATTRPFAAMPSDAPGLGTDAPFMNTELLIDRDQLLARTTIEYPRASDAVGEVEIESDLQWQPVGTQWGDAQLLDVRPGSTLDRRRYILKWIGENSDSNASRPNATPTKRSIVTTWIPTGDPPLRNVLFAECRDRRVRPGTLRYARTAGSAWTIDGISTWIPSINARERIEWSELLENPIATSLKIPTSGGFGVLRQQTEAKAQRARVTNQWMVGKEHFDLTSKIEFASPLNNRTTIVIDVDPGYRVSRVTSRGTTIPFLQWSSNQREYLQILIDRDSGDITELVLYADSMENHLPVFSEPIPFWRSDAISMSEQTTEIFANPVWSIQLQNTDSSEKLVPGSVQGKDRAKSLFNIPIATEPSASDNTLRLQGNRITQRWKGLLVLRPVRDDSEQMDWELIALGNDSQRVLPSVSISTPIELATRWSCSDSIIEIPDLNLDRRILSVTPKALSNDSNASPNDVIGSSNTDSGGKDAMQKTEQSITPDPSNLNIDRIASPVSNAAPSYGVTFRIRFASESGVTIAPSDAYKIELLANPDVRTWFAIEASIANQIDLSLYEVLDPLALNLGTSIPEFDGTMLVRPKSKSSTSDFREARLPSATGQPILNQALSATTNTNSNPKWKLATHELVGPHAIEPDRLVCVSQFWCSGIDQNPSSPLRWTHSLETRCEWVRINGQSVSFQQTDNQIAVPFESVGYPLHVELWTSFPCPTQDRIPTLKLLQSVSIPSDGTIQTTYFRARYGEQREPDDIWVQKESPTANPKTDSSPASFSGVSTAMWVQDHAITSLTLLREAISDADEVDESRLLEGDRGNWIEEFALQSAYWLARWASVDEDFESEDYAKAISEWAEIRSRHPALVEIIPNRRSPIPVALVGSVDPLATDGMFLHEPTAATSPTDGSSGTVTEIWSGIGPFWLRTISTLIMILAMVLSAWFWGTNKTKLLQSPWWLLTATSGLTWLLTGSLLPAILMMSVALLLAIDSYWIVSERFRQNAIRGPR